MKTSKIKKAILSENTQLQLKLLTEDESAFLVCCIMLDALWILKNLQKSISWKQLKLEEICPLHYAQSPAMADFWLNHFTLEQLILPSSRLGDAISFQEEGSQMQLYLKNLQHQ